MKLNAFGIICSDIQASLNFYRLLDLTFDAYSGEQLHYEAPLAGGMKLMLDAEEVMASFVENFTTPEGNDRISLAVECGSPDEVDAAFIRILEAGYTGVRPPFDAIWQQRYATVADPDGNDVDLYAPL